MIICTQSQSRRNSTWAQDLDQDCPEAIFPVQYVISVILFFCQVVQKHYLGDVEK